MRRNLLLDEEPIDHLVQRADTSHHNQVAETLLDSRYSQLRRMKFMLGKDRLGVNIGFAQQP